MKNKAIASISPTLSTNASVLVGRYAVQEVFGGKAVQELDSFMIRKTIFFILDSYNVHA